MAYDDCHEECHLAKLIGKGISPFPVMFARKGRKTIMQEYHKLPSARNMLQHVHNIEVEGKLGVAKVFETETDAMEYQNEYGGVIVCCGGYYNSVWYPYD